MWPPRFLIPYRILFISAHFKTSNKKRQTKFKFKISDRKLVLGEASCFYEWNSIQNFYWNLLNFMVDILTEELQNYLTILKEPQDQLEFQEQTTLAIKFNHYLPIFMVRNKTRMLFTHNIAIFLESWLIGIIKRACKIRVTSAFKICNR